MNLFALLLSSKPTADSRKLSETLSHAPLYLILKFFTSLLRLPVYHYGLISGKMLRTQPKETLLCLPLIHSHLTSVTVWPSAGLQQWHSRECD